MVNGEIQPSPIHIQLAIQGGGAKIYALVAALEVFQEYERDKKIKVTQIAGTSAGAITGSLYAAGVSMETVRKQLAEFPIHEVWHRPPWFIRWLTLTEWLNVYRRLKSKPEEHKPHIVQKLHIAWRIIQNKPIARERKIEELLYQLFKASPAFRSAKYLDFKTLSDNGIPMTIIATNLASLDRKVYNARDSGGEEVLPAILSSAGLPFFFRVASTKYKIQFVDGGLCSNLPIEELNIDDRELGQIVALSFIDQGNNQVPESWLKLGVSLLDSAIASSVEQAKRAIGVSVIELDPQGISTFDFQEAKEALNPNDIRYQKIQEITREGLGQLLQGVPRELRDAKARLASINDVYAKLKYSALNNNRYLLVKYPYTSIPEVNTLQNSLEDAIIDNLGASTEFPERNEYFDAVRYPEYAICNETIYTFPFFLSLLRLITWGVIPYGRHRRIGVLLHESHPAYSQLIKYDVTGMTNKKDLRKKINSAWIYNLLDGLANQQKNKSGKTVFGKLFSIEGYLYNELVPLLILDTGNDLMQSKFLKCGERVSPKDLKHTKVPQAMLDPKQYDLHAMILDLALREEVEKSVHDKGYKVLAIQHELNIPVGIGFSLLMTPRLLQSEVWRNLAKIARDILHPASDKLLNIGIELDFT
jgi:predicted acylesterase/phospholipase RssA